MSAKILNFSARKNQAGTFAMIDKSVLKWDIEQKSIWLTLKIWEAYGHYDKEWHDRTVALSPGDILTSVPALAKESGTSISKTKTRLQRLEAQGLILQRVIKGPKGYEGRIITVQKFADQIADQIADQEGPRQPVPQGLQDEPVLSSPTKSPTKSPTNIRQEKEDRRREDNYSAPLKIDRALEKELKEARAIWSNCFMPREPGRFVCLKGLNRHAEVCRSIYGLEVMRELERELEAKGALGAWNHKAREIKEWMYQNKAAPR
jgi:hypothetical protein